MLFERKDRHVLPRWRDFRTTLALGELQNSKKPDATDPDDTDAIARRTEEFKVDQDIWHAADLLSSAFVIGDETNAELARQFILSKRIEAPAALVSFASGTTGANIQLDFSSVDEEAQHRLIHRVRARLRNEPRNAILWVELARLYTVQGNSKRAIRCMTTAANLAPDNRFVVRSAARLFLHEHEASTALKIIRNAAGAKRDPWLLAAEIATASAAGTSALLVKIGINRNDDENLPAFARTELSSALATLEMESGKTRKARQLFRKSLQGPNENSIAQAEWANRQIGGLEIGRELLETPRSYEASASLNLTAGEFHYALSEGLEWLHDQPFSKGPAVFTSYVAGLLEDYEKSIGILRKSLSANPDDPILINNLVFALGSANQLEEARKTIRKIDFESFVSGTPAITLMATWGMLLFRSGEPEGGRKFYQLAISRAAAQENAKYRAMAALYLAREELLASTPVAEKAVNRALVEASRIDDKEVAIIADQVRKLEESAAKPKTPISAGGRRVGRSSGR